MFAQAAPNSAAVYIALIGSITTVATIIITQRGAGRKREEQTKKIDKATGKVEDVRVLVDGRLSQLLKDGAAMRKDNAAMRKDNKVLRSEISEVKALLAGEKLKRQPKARR
jgi:hypothetical protein